MWFRVDAVLLMAPFLKLSFVELPFEGAVILENNKSEKFAVILGAIRFSKPLVDFQMYY